MFKSQPYPVTLQLELGKLCSLFVKIIFDMLGSDNVKEQETLSATELGEHSLVHAALTVQMKKKPDTDCCSIRLL